MVAFMAEIIAKTPDNRNAVLLYFRLAPYCDVLAVFVQNFAKHLTVPFGRGNFSFQSNCASPSPIAHDGDSMTILKKAKSISFDE